MAMVTCSNCKYHYNNDGTHECRRYPPVIWFTSPMTNDHTELWPEIDANDRCGEGEVDS